MKPSRASKRLIQIASVVRTARRPSLVATRAALRMLLAALDEDDVFHKLMLDALPEELQKMPLVFHTQWGTKGSDDIIYDVSFPKIDTLDGHSKGDNVDLVVEVHPRANNPIIQKPFTMHLHGAWSDAGDCPVDVIAGGPLPDGYAEYLSRHVNSLIYTAWEKAADRINTQMDQEIAGS